MRTWKRNVLKSIDNKKTSHLVRRASYFLVSTAIMIIALFVAEWLANASFWLAITVGLGAGILAIGYLMQCLFLLRGREISLLPFQKLILTVCGVMIVVIATELFLQWREQRATATTPSTTTDSHNSASGLAAGKAMIFLKLYAVFCPSFSQILSSMALYTTTSYLRRKVST